MGLESSATPASVALWEDGRLLGEFFIHTKLTHSQTVLPMAESLLRSCGRELSEVDLFAVAAGPGSFTGLRIGIAAIKGMAFGSEKPCYCVSTLAAMAYRFVGLDAFIVPVMDARREQVYTAFFRTKVEKISRLCEDKALSLQELLPHLAKMQKEAPVILVGDGAALCYENIKQKNGIFLPGESLRYQCAAGVCQAAWVGEEGMQCTPGELEPNYLRLPQAQRELLEKQREKTREEEAK